MKNWCAAWWLVVVFALTGAAPGEDSRSRVIHGQVLQADGTPAVGRRVLLIGLARGSTRPYSDLPDRSADGWDFLTDQKGRFTAKLGGFNSWENPSGLPGWGTYVFVVENGRRDAGAVSPHLLCYHQVPEYYRSDPPTEWGPCQTVPASGLSLTLQLKRGITVQGRVLAFPGGDKPLSGVEVTAFTNLYSESHSGHGGEVLTRTTRTARDGSFTLAHVYPAKMYLGLGPDLYRPDGIYWLRTALPGAGWTDVVDVLNPPAEGKITGLRIMAAQTETFEYKGRITDRAGKPIANASVLLGPCRHLQARTFEDTHTMASVKTDAEGSYSILLGTPWVRFITVEVAGYLPGERECEYGKPLMPPGSYDFTLAPKP